jgi:nitrate reductase delta subunit
MTNEKKAILAVLSRLLDYPDPTFTEEQAAITSFIREYISSEKIQMNVLAGVQCLFEIPVEKLARLYVETFDHKEKANLYLTAHELGDSRKRGVALIQLQKLILEAGYECAEKELVDYIPMLLEFLAVIQDEAIYEKLSRRVSYAVHRILANLQNENPYKRVLELGTMFVFEPIETEELSALDYLREQADLDELPFPIMYR